MAALERGIEVHWHDPFELIYNAAPTMQLSVVTRGRDGLRVGAMRWGLIPGWWKEAKPPKLTINARVEEAADKAMWRGAFRGSRCLVPAIGWYEWRSEERVDVTTGEIKPVRQPYFIHLDGLAPICFAGLWSSWRPEPGAESLQTFSILTRAAAPQLASLHDRMPVVLPPEAYDEWLDDENRDAGNVSRLVTTRALGEFKAYPVSTYVNDPRNQGERCIENVPATAAGGTGADFRRDDP